MLPVDVRYKIKTATIKDVFEHLVKCNENFIPPLDQKVDMAAYSQKIAKNSITFEAWVNDELAGLIAAYFNDEKKQSGFITNVSTLKKYAGNRIASHLMENCISYGVQQQFSEISLEVLEDNIIAIKLYKKYGFHPTGNKGNLMTMKKKLTDR